MQNPNDAPPVPEQPYYGPPVAPKPKTNVLLIVVLCTCGCLFLMVPIIAAILFPVFAQARGKARETACLSNVKQMSLGMLMYVQDYDENFTPAQSWMTNIDPYIKNEAVYHCPQISSGQKGTPYGYALNSALSKARLADIASPETTLMIYESNTLSANASDPCTSYPVPGRHLERDIFGLVDGHAHPILPSQLSELTSGKSPFNSNTESGGQP